MSRKCTNQRNGKSSHRRDQLHQKHRAEKVIQHVLRSEKYEAGKAGWATLTVWTFLVGNRNTLKVFKLGSPPVRFLFSDSSDDIEE